MYFDNFKDQFCPLSLMSLSARTPSISQGSTGSTISSTLPPGPPPPFTPIKTHVLYQTVLGGPGTFFRPLIWLTTCRFQYVYMFLNNGSEFWSWVNNIVGNNVYGWRWDGTKWVPLTMDGRSIQGVVCYPAYA